MDTDAHTSFVSEGWIFAKAYLGEKGGKLGIVLNGVPVFCEHGPY